MTQHNSLCEAALQRHLDAFKNADIPAIMEDYHPECTFQMPHTTLTGKKEIEDMFTEFFKVKPAGSKVDLNRKDTIISNGIGISYIVYSMKSNHVDFPVATDTFIHDKDGKFTHQTFAGHDVHVASESKDDTLSSLKVGWIGLGQMGKAHVSNLIEKGFKNIVVWNRSVESVTNIVKLGAIAAASPKDVVERCDVTFVMLSNSVATREVYNKHDGILAGLSQGKGIIECASIDSDCIKELQILVSNKGGRFVSSPVAGHSGMARNATCQLICAGDKSLYDDASSIREALAKKSVWLGEDIGSSVNLKLIINGLLASITASIATAISLSDKSDIDREALRSIITGHAMNSPLLQLCLKMMYDGKHDPLFMIQHIKKDTTLCIQLAESKKLESNLMKAVEDLYNDAMLQGLAEMNWTSVHKSISNTK